MRSHGVLEPETGPGSGMAEACVKAETSFLKVLKGEYFTTPLRSNLDALKHLNIKTFKTCAEALF